ncbi:MAG: ABC transporter ATP-binding protein [Cyanobacteria bacterium SZAS LIN-5]|nr:ABC transporter ATP-binding protein [Cyanobacteria bacterium SZAS LIN-5]
MTASSSTGEVSSPVSENKPLPPLKNWFKQFSEALQVMAGTPRILRLVWQSHRQFTAILISANIVLGLAPMAEIWSVKLIIDGVAQCIKTGNFSGTEQANLIGLLVVLALIRLVSSSMEPTVRLVQEQLGDHLVRDINLLILRKANSLVDISVFENPTFHDKLTRAQNEASYRPLAILSNVTAISRSFISLTSMICVLASFQPWLAAAVIALAMPNLIAQIKMQHESWAIQNFEIPEVRKMRYFAEVLTRVETASEIRLFNLGDLFIKKYLDKFAEFQKAHAKLRANHWIRNFILANIAAVGLVASYSYVVFSALRNAISLGSLSMYLTATTQIEYQLEIIIWSIAHLYQGNLFAKNMFDFLEVSSPVVLPATGAAKLVPKKFEHGIRFENVSFHYPDSERKVFENLSFELKAGQSIALVGENGAGKTTIVKLLSRLYEPVSGRILVDGVDLKEYDLTSWRANLSVIFQNYVRFHLTARENIGVGNVDFLDDMERIVSAAERASAVSLIEKFSDKYETMLGKWFSADKGTELSGGEWQKIALSRAFMRAGEGEAQLLILDEPTSALDAQAEYDIYLRFSELTRGKTTLLISHRFSTVKMADVVLLLEKGKIIEQGSHDELMLKNGEYARLYNLQADRYK